MALHGFAHLGIEPQNILEIMLNRTLADGIQMDFHFVQSAPVIQQVLLFPEHQSRHGRQYRQQTFEDENQAKRDFFGVVFFQDRQL